MIIFSNAGLACSLTTHYFKPTDLTLKKSLHAGNQRAHVQKSYQNATFKMLKVVVRKVYKRFRLHILWVERLRLDKVCACVRVCHRTQN